MKNSKKTKFNSLTDFKEHLESDKSSYDEKVVYFNGRLLRTDKATYGLAFGELVVIGEKNEC